MFGTVVKHFLRFGYAPNERPTQGFAAKYEAHAMHRRRQRWHANTNHYPVGAQHAKVKIEIVLRRNRIEYKIEIARYRFGLLLIAG